MNVEPALALAQLAVDPLRLVLLVSRDHICKAQHALLSAVTGITWMQEQALVRSAQQTA